MGTREESFFWLEKNEDHSEAVAANLQQPQNIHDSPPVELPWSWVGHSSSGPSWADQEVHTLYDISLRDKDERSQD